MRHETELTPQEKAKELFDKYQIAGSIWYVDITKKYATIAVNEIIEELSSVGMNYNINFGKNLFPYWIEVISEIEKLQP